MSLPQSQADREKLVNYLRDPSKSLPAFAKVVDQKTEQLVAYDPYAITDKCQATILSYVSDAPVTEHGQTRWLVDLTGRQMGKSLTTALAFYPKAAYNIGFDAVTIADTDDRATYLHQRVHLAHEYWPKEVRAETIPNPERRKMTFLPESGGQMRVLSAQKEAAGIGQSISGLHASEVAFWPNAAEAFTLLFPAMYNRDRALMVMECTPAPAGTSSVEWWRDICQEAKRGMGRWLYAFQPFWDGKLNRRPWPKGSKPTNEELALLERFGNKGLTLENLAFRRFVMEMDREIRLNPDLFAVFYPFDDITCWMASARGSIHASLLEKHTKGILVKWRGPYMEYEEPQVEATYVIGADGAGWGVRDHASFQVLKVWRGEWTQVACFADDRTDPVSFSEKLLEAAKRYNNATIVVESNGVGAGPLTYLLSSGYPHVYHEEAYKPGKWASGKSVDEMLSYLAEALKDELILRDEDTVSQLQSYKNDKRIEDTAQSEQLRGGKVGKNRRERHHWDKVSALKMAVVGARDAIQKSKPKVEDALPDNVVIFNQMSYNEWRKHCETNKPKKESARRPKYRPVKRK